MATIHVLDQDTINQIAAGEVVERPASVVKELVENAVDAESTMITVEIKGGGIDFIRITDNGFGIEKDQVRHAFLPHATSKISKASDLVNVASLGFRGEALASIAAVAKVELVTKTDIGISGIRCLMEGGEEKAFEEVGCPEGTTFVITDLFYNTPARRKFLKSRMTEAGYVEAFMQRLSLSHPHISFRFINDGKNKLSTSGNGNLKDVIYQIYGRDVAMNLLEVNRKEGDISVEGYVGKPIISRGNRNYENYFVNGRYLKDPIISRAIEDGYKGHAMVHKFPFTALMIGMETTQVDVNVHPQKMEMRFGNAEELYSAVMNAVRGSFVRKDLIPKVSIGTPEKEKRNLEKSPEPFEKKRRSIARIEERFNNLSRDRIQEIEERKKNGGNDADEPGKKPQGRKSIEERLAGLGLGSRESLAEGSADLYGSRKDIDQAMKGTPGKPGSGKPEPQKTEPQKSEPAPVGTQMKLTDIPMLSEAARPRHRIIGQVFKTYWLVEYMDDLFFVDQHAAHEKVMYEKLKKDLMENTIHQQLIAPPAVLTFSLKEQEKFGKFKEAFEKLGFAIEEFGGNEYCIRAVPANLLDIDPQQLFLDIFDQIDENSTGLDYSVITDRLASMACKAAVKGNNFLSYPEMDSLMDQLLALENPYQCPHGRPTIISMSKREIEKKFKRIQ